MSKITVLFKALNNMLNIDRVTVKVWEFRATREKLVATLNNLFMWSSRLLKRPCCDLLSIVERFYEPQWGLNRQKKTWLNSSLLACTSIHNISKGISILAWNCFHTLRLWMAIASATTSLYQNRTCIHVIGSAFSIFFYPWLTLCTIFFGNYSTLSTPFKS